MYNYHLCAFVFSFSFLLTCVQALYDPREVKLRDLCSFSSQALATTSTWSDSTAAAAGAQVGVPEAEQEALALCAHGAMSMFARTIEADAAPQVLQFS